MANYNSNLKNVGSSGVEFPNGWKWEYGVPVPDAYMNYALYNLIADVKDHLVPLTNARLESSTGATRPTSPADGELFFNTSSATNPVLEVYSVDLAAWIALGSDSDLGSHVGDTTNPHSVTAAQAGAIEDVAGSVDEAHLSFDVATQAELDAHAGDVANPHSVTATQASALPTAGGSMTGNIDYQQNNACNVVMDARTADPAAPVAGQFWFRSDLGEFRGYDGTNVVTFTVA